MSLTVSAGVTLTGLMVSDVERTHRKQDGEEQHRAKPLPHGDTMQPVAPARQSESLFVKVYHCGNWLGMWGPPPAQWYCRRCKSLLTSDKVEVDKRVASAF